MSLLRLYFNRSLRKCVACRYLATQFAHGPNADKGEDVRDLRNIGIIAHIDAGKTTTTERMLYYSGFTKHLGDVDHGDTVTDYLEEERNRGITISSAAVTYQWKKHRVNLIDTPGHVDFTIEVERSLRVLDGAVTILDASAGVEAQTVTVWKQATKHDIPSIIYLNKLDKLGVSVELCLESIRQKLHIDPFLINFPYGESLQKFKGLVDIVDMVKYEWDLAKSTDGRKFSVIPLTEKEDGKFWEYAVKERTNLIGRLSDTDEKIADEVLLETSMDKIKPELVRKALRNATVKRQLTPVMCGSSLKNKGVQLLMDAIYDYLPCPNDREFPFLQYYGSELCAFAFKTIHNQQKMPQTFFRIYSGSLHQRSDVHNINRNCHEKVKTLSRILANEYHNISAAHPGDIVCVSGLKETRTGDTITSKEGLAKIKPILREHRHHEDEVDLHDDSHDDDLNHDVVLAGLQVPSPVFFCSVEPPSMAYQKDLDLALECLQREDPSLKVEVNQETGQTILSGMGELHLEVVKHRLLSEYKIDVYMGPLQIAYKETIDDPVTHTETLDSVIGGKKQHVTVAMTVQPSEQQSGKKVISYKPHTNEKTFITSPRFRKEYKSAMENGIKTALSYGPILNFPVINVEVVLHSVELSRDTSPNVAAAAASMCLHNALKKAILHLMEPIMKLEIITDPDFSSVVLHDLASRRTKIEHVHQNPKDNTKVIQATVPLAELREYSNSIRKITHGQSSLNMEFSHYEEMSEEDKNKAIEKVTGFPVNPAIFNPPSA
ncbi:ribosome-releasing factor 2, mitochondrial-like [Saccostrea echinata]|uniref:ribosome-releasing factor 2, mitochondrial-like n=1 Tax=Saccostrea echinata TaxID=191078 RepID=UPI002A82E9D1|nr:ribosome-releasing factor 2, mitochondrial-like [Saccostrea echinata]